MNAVIKAACACVCACALLLSAVGLSAASSRHSHHAANAIAEINDVLEAGGVDCSDPGRLRPLCRAKMHVRKLDNALRAEAAKPAGITVAQHWAAMQESLSAAYKSGCEQLGMKADGGKQKLQSAYMDSGYRNRAWLVPHNDRNGYVWVCVPQGS